MRLLWQDSAGQKVLRDEANGSSSDPGPLCHRCPAGFYPSGGSRVSLDQATDREGWTEVAGNYRAPSGAVRVVVELHLQWAPLGKIVWSDITLLHESARGPQSPPGRGALSAAAGKTPAENCRCSRRLIADAARQKADLVVLPETLTYFGTGLSFAECAESIPGPSTEYFGALARKHNLYIVAGLIERDGHLIYNVAVLLMPGRKGGAANTARSVCRARKSSAGSCRRATNTRSSDTRFGKLG